MAEKKEHPQAKWLRAIADGETVECWLGEQWVEMTFPSAVHEFLITKDDNRYRIKPQTITIGKYEVAEPIKVAPTENTLYWTLNQIAEGTASSYTWSGDDIDNMFLDSGMCWLKREDAELAAKAITELLTGKSA